MAGPFSLALHSVKLVHRMSTKFLVTSLLPIQRQLANHGYWALKRPIVPAALFHFLVAVPQSATVTSALNLQTARASVLSLPSKNNCCIVHMWLPHSCVCTYIQTDV